VKFLEYSLAGMACGFIGQGIANAAMMARRAQKPDAEYTVDPPPLVQTALVWGLFMGVSSNLRYQAVFGLERLVDMTLAKNIPAVRFFSAAMCFFVPSVHLLTRLTKLTSFPMILSIVSVMCICYFQLPRFVPHVYYNERSS
jgi:hypothetical protein